MIYILYGNEEYLIQEALSKIISENKDIEIIRINGLSKDFGIQNMIENCDSVGIFSNKKLIIVNDPPFLINKIDDSESKMIINFFNNSPYDVDLILYTINDSFNERLKLFKDLSKLADTKKFNKLKYQDYSSTCYQMAKESNLNITKDALKLLISSCNGSLTVFNNNLNTLSNYPEVIDNEVIEKMLIVSNEEDIFKLVNSITDKNISSAISNFRKIYSSNNENILGTISLIVGQLRFLYEVSYYYKQGFTTDEIMDKTNTSSNYRVQKAIDSISKFKNNEILVILDKLAEVNYKLISNDELDKQQIFEMFIVDLIKK